MNFNSTQCCGVQEITNLCNHPTGEDAMFAFCANQLEKGCQYHTETRKPGKIYSNYYFTAAVYDSECSIWNTYKDMDEVEDGMFNPYGHRFAKFIEENGLGTVITPGAIINKAFHPDHKTQVWIWTPNHEALLKWWAENRPKAKLNELKNALRHKQNYYNSYLKHYGTDHSYVKTAKAALDTAQAAYDAELLRLAEAQANSTATAEVVKAVDVSPYINLNEDEEDEPEDDDYYDDDYLDYGDDLDA